MYDDDPGVNGRLTGAGDSGPVGDAFRRRNPGDQLAEATPLGMVDTVEQTVAQEEVTVFPDRWSRRVDGCLLQSNKP